MVSKQSLRTIVALLAFILVTPVVLSTVQGLLGPAISEAFECWCRQEGDWRHNKDAAGKQAGAASGPKPVQGRFVKLSRPDKGCMHFTEVEVYSTKGGANVAAGKPVSVSSIYNNSAPGSLLTDGKPDTYHHSSCNDVPWAIIDLGSSLPIAQIRVFNRKDCCTSRANGVTVSILNDAQVPVYTSEPFKDRSGSPAYSDGSNGYLIYELSPPDVKVTAS